MQHKTDLKNLISGIVVFVFGLAYYLGSFSIQKYRGYGDIAVTARTFPQVLGILIMGLSAIQVAQSRITVKAEDSASAKKMTRDELISVGISLGITIAFIFLLRTLGFILCTTAYLFSQFMLLTPKGKRNYRVIITVTLVTPILLYYVFVYGLTLILPQGILG